MELSARVVKLRSSERPLAHQRPATAAKAEGGFDDWVTDEDEQTTMVPPGAQ